MSAAVLATACIATHPAPTVTRGRRASQSTAVPGTRCVRGASRESLTPTPTSNQRRNREPTLRPIRMRVRGVKSPSIRYLVGDTRDLTAKLPDASMDLVMTSPPFLALRSYLPADHPDKHREIGSEPGPAEFIQTLLELTAEWRRVLAPHGSICVELGDTYAVGGGRDAWPLHKSMCGIPHLYHLSLAYGRNLLTGQPSPAGKWRVRNVVAWCRPNPPVGRLGDKYRPATSYMTIATVASDRYFDLDAVRNKDSSMKPGGSASSRQASGTRRGEGEGSRRASKGPIPNPGGAPPLDFWVIPTKPYTGSHYATYPPALCLRPILSMCPERVCAVCGQPSRRMPGASIDAERESSWTDCGHDAWRRGVVLDPFAGSGTTMMVAHGNGRDSIGFDIDQRNYDLARERIGPLFFDSGQEL